ncbi:MAG: hypothetical protein IH585_11840 [Anaerolineaceae bacterium]|nr:hypothetical protein [Anaerolineaceae bacterium]
MKTKILSKIVLMFSLVSIVFAACTPYQEPDPAATIPPKGTEIPANPTREVATREVPDKFDQLTPVVPIDKEPIDMTPISPADLPVNFQDVAEQAITALAENLSIQKDQIALISVQSVVWSDSSLGCPQPDMNYLMVLTDGYRVVLAVEDQPYYYHANQRGYGLLCESPNPPYSEGAVDR